MVATVKRFLTCGLPHSRCIVLGYFIYVFLISILHLVSSQKNRLSIINICFVSLNLAILPSRYSIIHNVGGSPRFSVRERVAILDLNREIWLI